MKPSIITNKHFLLYVTKFIGIFCLAYFGTLAIIGLSAPGGYYSRVVANHFNYVSWIRESLLHASKWLLSLFGYHTYIASRYSLKLKGGMGVRMVYSCVGYGIMSFWMAFIIANNGTVKKKLRWIAGGLISIWTINVIRVSALLVATNRHWVRPWGFDHHTWFNIACYTLIFSLMYFFDKSSRTPANTSALINNL